MLSLIIFTLLTTGALAIPRPAAQTDKGESLSMCERATNCELRADATGKLRPRFIAGMEPGSENYNRRLSKRDYPPGYPQTEVTFSDSTIYWGCGVDPATTLGNLSSLCNGGSCDETASYDLDITYVTPTPGTVDLNAGKEKLNIAASGHYPTWFRDGLVQAVQAAAGATNITQWTRGQEYHLGPLKRDNGPQAWKDTHPKDIGTCDVAMMSGYLGMTVMASPDDMEAQIDVTISLENIEPGWCKFSEEFSLGSAVAGAFGSAGAVVAGFMGVASAVCSG